MTHRPFRLSQRIASTLVVTSAGLLLGPFLFGIFINLFLHKLLGPAVLPYPSAEKVGTDYLSAIISKNKNYIPQHDSCTHTVLINDIQQYGGAKIRDVSVQSEWRSGNSNHTFEITTVRFVYHQQDEDWQPGEIILMTASNLLEPPIFPFRKIICSGG